MTEQNPTKNTFVAAGLMSGTSMDGIDSALIVTDGEGLIKDLASYSLEYDSKFKLLLKSCEQAVAEHGGDLKAARNTYHARNQSTTFDEIIEKSTDLHAKAVRELLKKNNYTKDTVDIVGYHGQTLFHNPANKITIQAGNAQRLADSIGIPVIYDFRSNDIQHGGQGAPFAPLYHQALAKQSGHIPIVIANCGGISNVTIIGAKEEELYAYDCGPGNTLIDRFVQLKTGERMDKDGIYGSQGQVIKNVLLSLRKKALSLNNVSNYLDKKPPKSLDVNDIKLIPEVEALNLQDGCATLEAFTAECIVESLDALSIPIPKLWILAGGGWNNKVITNELSIRLKQKLGSDIQIQHAEQVGWQGQAIEAQVFAYLAVRSLRRLPLSTPGTTGVPKPLTGGKIAFPQGNQQNASDKVRSVL